MAVLAEARSIDERHLATAARKRIAKPVRQVGREEAIILRIHPQHRHARGCAELTEEIDQWLVAAHHACARRAAAAGEADRGSEARRRLCGEPNGREPSGGMADC